MRDPRHDILFEPVKIGPVTAKNRFYQVPHCNGGGYREPNAVAEMRRVKSEGGWGVIYTEQADVHWSSDITPYIELRNWNDDDLPLLSMMAEAMTAHGSLAGIELVHAGVNSSNLYTREVPMAPSPLPVMTFTADPVQARAMDGQDFKNLRAWHRAAFRRAKVAGFDLICLYAAHGFGIIQHFLSPRTNQRTDEYGGSLKNRSRLMRELLSDARDEIGDRCGVSIRLALDELAGPDCFDNNQLRDLIEMHAELPDLWDFAHGSWEKCSGTSRFAAEAAQEDLIKGLKLLTPKPVVGVGRFTSPDEMVRQIKQGHMDFIGAARPSIADPFLPNKISEGRSEDIRECIGCNICITGDFTASVSRCTQNPSFMEEWRRGWHPERMPKSTSSDSVLVVGAGPAGLSAAHRAGQRGYAVALADASRELGGRVARESRLPGLSAWIRVRDYRAGQIGKMENISVYPESLLAADDVLALGHAHVAIATGSHWRRDGVGRNSPLPITVDVAMPVYTPDDVMAGKLPQGRVVVYDDDHYYMASVLAELLVQKGCEVILVTPASKVSAWSVQTLEQGFIQARMIERGVKLQLDRGLVAVREDNVRLACSYTMREEDFGCDSVVLVTSRLPEDTLYRTLIGRQAEWSDNGIKSVRAIGDAEAPAAIAWATFAGHRYADELDKNRDPLTISFRRHVTVTADGNQQ